MAGSVTRGMFISAIMYMSRRLICYVQSLIKTNSVEQSSCLVTQTVQKEAAFYGTYRLITVFKRICHWTISEVSLIQSTTSQTMLPSFRRLDLSNGFTIKVLYAFLISLMCVIFSFTSSFLFNCLINGAGIAQSL
jgi:hypothetical protein